MKNHILGLYTVIYHVEDIERAKKAYSQLLGKEPHFAEPFYVGFNLGGYELGLLPAASTPRKEKGCTAYWGVADIRAACAALEAKGTPLFEPITDVGGDIKVATFLDIDSNIVGLIENPHFGKTGG